MKKFKKIVNKKEIAVSYGDFFFNIPGYWMLTRVDSLKPQEYNYV